MKYVYNQWKKYFFLKQSTFQTFFPIHALIWIWDSPTDGWARIIFCLYNFFSPPYAAAGIRTHTSRVALTRDLLKDALPTELPRCGWYIVNMLIHFQSILLLKTRASGFFLWRVCSLRGSRLFQLKWLKYWIWFVGSRCCTEVRALANQSRCQGFEYLCVLDLRLFFWSFRLPYIKISNGDGNVINLKSQLFCLVWNKLIIP